jgi:peptidoglycan-associated lipoprotein
MKLLILIGFILMAGCSTQVTKPVDITTASSMSPLNDPNNILSKRIVQFDYDQTVIKKEYGELLNAHVEYLKKNPSVRIIIEGHADERGSHEYNLSLGQKRSIAVKKYLNLGGISDNQIETISYGKERPVDSSQNETAWALNRRTEFVYP